MEKLRKLCDSAAADGIFFSPSMKARFSSRKPRSGSSISLATPLLEAAQIILKWQPRGSGEDAATIVATVVISKVFDLIMMVAAATNATQGRTFFVTF